MSDPFDPYYTWLGIPREEQPPDYYRLVAVRRFENNPEVITNALQARETLVRSFESGPRAEAARQMLDELAKARECLLHLDSKGAYDRDMRNKDAPKLSTTSGNRRPARPDAPRRPRWASDSASDAAPVAVERGPAAATQPIAAPNYQTDPVAMTPVSVPMPGTAYPATAYRPAKPRATPLFQNPLVLVAIGVVLLLFVAMIAAAAAILGGSVLLARLPSPESSNPSPSQGESPSGDPSAPFSGPLLIVNDIDAAGQTGADRKLTLSLGEPIDLLAGIQPQKQKPRLKSFSKDAKGWETSGQAVYEALQFPTSMPQEYVLETNVTLEEKSGGVIQQLIYNGKPFHITVDGFDGETDGRGIRTALEMIDGRRPHNASTYPCEMLGSVLKINRPTELRYTVLKDKVLVECDGRLVLSWTGGMHRISTNWLFSQNNANSISWGTWKTKCTLSKCIIRPVWEAK